MSDNCYVANLLGKLMYNQQSLKKNGWLVLEILPKFIHLKTSQSVLK